MKTHKGVNHTWVIQHFPKNYVEMIYCEVFCGGANVFLNKKPSKQEIINDFDKGLMSIYKSLRDESKEFIQVLKKIKYNEKTFQEALDTKPCEDFVGKAVQEYILCRMSRAGQKRKFAWSEKTRGGQPGELNAWKTMLEQLPTISKRLHNCVVLGDEFEPIIRAWNNDSEVLFYLDPPRIGDKEGEMLQSKHALLLGLIKKSRSNIIISGYSSPLYNKHLADWNVIKKEIPGEKRLYECLWTNY